MSRTRIVVGFRKGDKSIVAPKLRQFLLTLSVERDVHAWLCLNSDLKKMPEVMIDPDISSGGQIPAGNLQDGMTRLSSRC